MPNSFKDEYELTIEKELDDSTCALFAHVQKYHNKINQTRTLDIK